MNEGTSGVGRHEPKTLEQAIRKEPPRDRDPFAMRFAIQFGGSAISGWILTLYTLPTLFEYPTVWFGSFCAGILFLAVFATWGCAYNWYRHRQVASWLWIPSPLMLFERSWRVAFRNRHRIVELMRSERKLGEQMSAEDWDPVYAYFGRNGIELARISTTEFLLQQVADGLS